jgi:hypothetical protein
MALPEPARSAPPGRTGSATDRPVPLLEVELESLLDVGRRLRRTTTQDTALRGRAAWTRTNRKNLRIDTRRRALVETAMGRRRPPSGPTLRPARWRW